MQLKVPFRLARGLTVALAILVAHFAIGWLFDNLRIPRPDLGPVFATLLGDVSADPDSSAATRTQDAPRPPAPPPVQIVNEAPQERPR